MKELTRGSQGFFVNKSFAVDTGSGSGSIMYVCMYEVVRSILLTSLSPMTCEPLKESPWSIEQRQSLRTGEKVRSTTAASCPRKIALSAYIQIDTNTSVGKALVWNHKYIINIHTYIHVHTQTDTHIYAHMHEYIHKYK